MKLKHLFTGIDGEFDALDKEILSAVRNTALNEPVKKSKHDPYELFKRLEERAVTHLFALNRNQSTPTAEDDPFIASRVFAGNALRRNVEVWSEINSAFKEAGLRVAGFKGPFLNSLLRRPVERAPMSVDLDLLVEESSLNAAVGILRRLGYTKGLGIKGHQFYRLNQRWIDSLESEQGSYGQIAPMAKLFARPDLDIFGDDLFKWFPRSDLVPTPSGVRSLTSIDLHFDLGHINDTIKYPISADQLFQNTVTSEYLDTNLRTLDLQTMTWVLLYRAYLDTALFGERRFKLFADLAVMICSGGLSNDSLEKAAQEYPFIVGPIKESLDFIRYEIGIDVPRRPVDIDTFAVNPANTERSTAGHSAGVVVVVHGWGTTAGESPLINELRVLARTVGLEIEEWAPFDSAEDPRTVGSISKRLIDTFDAHHAARGNIQTCAVGISLGSAAVLRAALENSALDCLVTIGTCVTDNIDMPNAPSQSLPVESEAGTLRQLVPFLSGQVSSEFLRDLHEQAPISRLSDLTVPTLVLEGGRDTEWRRSDSSVVADVTKSLNNGSQYVVFPAGGHTLDNSALGASEAIMSWWRSIGFIESANV